MSKRSVQESKRVETSAQVPEMMWRAYPPAVHDNRKSWLARCARAMGWSPRRTKALFYCEARIVTADEWRTLNQRLDALKAAERRHEEESYELRAFRRVAGNDVSVAVRGSGETGYEVAGAGSARPRAIRQA